MTEERKKVWFAVRDATDAIRSVADSLYESRDDAALTYAKKAEVALVSVVARLREMVQ